MTIKAGDTVKCMKAPYGDKKTPQFGVEYEVASISPCGDYVRIDVGDGNVTSGWRTYRFVKVKDAPAPVSDALATAYEKIEQLALDNGTLSKKLWSRDNQIEALRIFLNDIQGYTTPDQDFLIGSISGIMGFEIETKTVTTIKYKDQ